MKVIIFVILCIILFINLVLIKINTNASFYYADGLTNLNNVMKYCRRNTNIPSEIKQCLLNIMNIPVQPQTHQQIVSQIDNAFNKCKGDQKCMLNAMNSMRR